MCTTTGVKQMEKYRVEEAIPVPLSRRGGRNRENKTKSKFLIKRKSLKISPSSFFSTDSELQCRKCQSPILPTGRGGGNNMEKSGSIEYSSDVINLSTKFPPKGVKSLCPYSFPFP